MILINELSIHKDRIKAYAFLMRIDRPVGSILLGWSTLWGLWLAGNGNPPAKVTLILLIGTFLMRSLGCILNDLADRNFDGFVERTKHRPLATKILNIKEALLIAFLLALLNLFLLIQLNEETIIMALICLFLAGFYPFCKRFFILPQLVLGLAYASPILFAHTAIIGRITYASLLLYLASVVWALIYDTFYAIVDRNDDLKIGLKSSAIFIMGFEFKFISSMMILMIGLLIYVGIISQLDFYYFLGLFFASILFIYELIAARNLIRERCFNAFIHNNYVGAFIFIGFVLNYLP